MKTDVKVVIINGGSFGWDEFNSAEEARNAIAKRLEKRTDTRFADQYEILFNVSSVLSKEEIGTSKDVVVEEKITEIWVVGEVRNINTISDDSERKFFRYGKGGLKEDVQENHGGFFVDTYPETGVRNFDFLYDFVKCEWKSNEEVLREINME